MQITYPITKEQLEKYRDLKLEHDNQVGRQEQVELLRARLESCGSSILLYEPKTGGVGTNKLADGVGELIELESKIKEQISCLGKAMLQIERAIQKLSVSQEREVLRLRYFGGMDWCDIQYVMDYGRSKVFEIHGNALRNLSLQTAD